MKRSNKPIFWSLFGAGGMLSALIGPMLILITVIAVPRGWGLSRDTMSYERVLAFARSWPGKIAILVVIMLFLFHAFHRLYHTLHDLGLHITPAIKATCHGLAGLATVICAVVLWNIGF
jgi:fumarate reductase subunit D